MKTITLHADEKLLEAAQERAQAENTTLDEQFQRWLEDYVRQQQRLEAFDRLTTELRGKVRIGRKLTREEMNER